MKLTVVLSAGLLLGCASVSDVVSTGQGAYLVMAEGVMGNSSSGAQLVKAQAQAASYCVKQGKQVETINSNEVPGGFGKVASATVNFRCLAAK